MYTPEKPSHIAQAEEANSVLLSRQLIGRGFPDKDDSQQIQIYRLSEFGMRKAQIGRLLDEFTPKVTLSKRKEDIAGFRANLRLLLYALVASAYDFKWLAIPTGDKNYAKGQRLGSFGLSRRRVENILEVLIQENLIVLGRKGFLDPRPNGQSKASQYFPTAELLEYFTSCLYEFSESLQLPCYHQFNKFPEEKPPEPRLWSSNEALLRKYNEFMADHWWARKGPTTRSFSETLHRGGRVHTAYQNIVNRRLPIRINTLLDGEPIAEPDFKSNHLRMAAALVGEQLPDDPYTVIAELSDTTRDIVKQFVTMVLGCVSKRQKGGQMKNLDKVGGSVTLAIYKRLLNAFDQEYPWLDAKGIFYNDTGAKMQRLEGEIGLRMFEWALEKEIPILSIHDSFAVQAKYANETWDMMNEVWKQVVLSHSQSLVGPKL
jgi:hypothetical protein